ETRMRVQVADHADTIRSMANLASMYRNQGNFKKAEKLDVMGDILERRGDHAQITEEKLVKIARSFDQEVMKFLSERRWNELQITERVVRAAAENRSSGDEVVRLLLKGVNE